MEIHRDDNVQVSQTIDGSSASIKKPSPPEPLGSIRSPLVQRDHNVIQKSSLTSTVEKSGGSSKCKFDTTPKHKLESGKEICKGNLSVKSPSENSSVHSPSPHHRSNRMVDEDKRKKFPRSATSTCSALDGEQTDLQRFMQEQRQNKKRTTAKEIINNSGKNDHESFDVHRLPSQDNNSPNDADSKSFFIHYNDDVPAVTEPSSLSLPVLQLGNFQESLWLDYGDDRLNTVGKSHSLSFVLQAQSQQSNNGKATSADNDDYHILEIEKVPTKKGFTLTMGKCDVNEDEGVQTKSLTDPFFIKEGERQEMTLTWKPTCAGGVRETIYLKMQRGRIRIIAHGKAREAPKTKKRESKVSSSSHCMLYFAKHFLLTLFFIRRVKWIT